jgi:hypothetical protein
MSDLRAVDCNAILRSDFYSFSHILNFIQDPETPVLVIRMKQGVKLKALISSGTGLLLAQLWHL